MFSVSEASVAVITGGSSGIGLNAARALRDRGLNVYELSRRAENAEPGVTHLQADVTDETQVNAAVAAWIEANGYRYAGPMFNIYHVSPHETRNPEEFVTEVCYPITK